jgi:hypothetical protein
MRYRVLQAGAATVVEQKGVLDYAIRWVTKTLDFWALQKVRLH